MTVEPMAAACSDGGVCYRSDEIERLRRGLERVRERHALADDWASAGRTEYSKAWHDGYITALATCSLIASEHLDPEAWAEDDRALNFATDKEWFERTGNCGHCGNVGRYCVCTEDDPCGCGPHELATEPMPCGWCRGTGIGLSPRRGQERSDRE